MSTTARHTILAAAVAATLLACGSSSETADGTTGSGGDAASASDAANAAGGAGGGGADAVEPTRLGTFSLLRSSLLTEEGASDRAIWASLYARFEAAVREEGADERADCTTTPIDGCRVTVCDASHDDDGGSGELPAYVGAGVLEVEGPSVPARAEPGSGFEYDLDLGSSEDEAWPFASGTSLAFSATGDVVPPFTSAIDAPARLQGILPSLHSGMVIDRDVPFELSWTPGPGGGGAGIQIDQWNHPAEYGPNVSVYCEVDVADGGIIIPAAALQDLSSDLGADLTVLSGDRGEVDAGDWRITVVALDIALLDGGVVIQ